VTVDLRVVERSAGQLGDERGGSESVVLPANRAAGEVAVAAALGREA
jgi:hypothetical protein